MIVIGVLSWLYATYAHLPAVAAVFFGIKAAILAIVAEAVLRVGKRALKNRVMVAIAAAAFVAIYFFKVPFPLVVLVAAADRNRRPALAAGEFSRTGHGGEAG